MATLEAGAKDKPVTVEQLTSTVGPSGAPIEAWTTLAPVVFMHKAGLNATERFMSDQVAARQYTRWVLWYRPDMDPDLVDVPKLRRLRYAGRQYDVTRAQIIDGPITQEIELVTTASTKTPAPTR